MTRSGGFGTHVDDGIAGGNEYFLEKLGQLKAIFLFGSEEKYHFTFTGIGMTQHDDYSISLSQKTYVEAIESIQVSRERRKNLKDPVSEQEKTQLRGLSGSLSYAAVNTRPDIAAKVGEIQSKTNQAKVEDILIANRTLHEAKTNSSVTIKILPIPLSQVRFCLFSDASFATATRTDQLPEPSSLPPLPSYKPTR